MYLVQTYQEYIEKEQLNIYGSSKLVLPKPELYVIYTGEKKVDEGYITLSEEQDIMDTLDISRETSAQLKAEYAKEQKDEIFSE